MKILIKYVVSFLFVFLLFPMNAIAGELIETKCSKDALGRIIPTIIVGPIVLEDFNKTGLIGVEALVVGNGNQSRFSGVFNYRKIGDRLELNTNALDGMLTHVTREQFQEHFGLFPEVTCTAG